jgi:hypothetical protein
MIMGVHRRKYESGTLPSSCLCRCTYVSVYVVIMSVHVREQSLLLTPHPCVACVYICVCT